MSPEKSTLDELRIDRSGPERKSSRAWILLVVLLLLAGGGGTGWWWMRHKGVEVRVATVREALPGGAKTVLNASGYVTARRQATVSSKVTGKVIEVLIEEGMAVQEGQVLARLDEANVKANLDLAKAQFESAKVSLEETKVRLDEAEAELRRVTALSQNRIASPSDLDHAKAEFNSLKARLDRQMVDVTVADRQVALWQQQLDDTVIRAPFAGMVVTKNAQPGEMISPMSAGGGFTRTGIGTIVDMDSLEIEVDVNENYINRVEPGQMVEATLDSYPEWRIPSKVIAIIPTADRQKATVKVRVGFLKLDPKILPDMGVKVAFQGAPGTAAVSSGAFVPKSAVRQQEGREVVWVVQNGHVERRAVTTGKAPGDDVLVTAGLAAGEKVVVAGPANLAEGDKVKELSP